jgi:hypothetical protein
MRFKVPQKLFSGCMPNKLVIVRAPIKKATAVKIGDNRGRYARECTSKRRYSPKLISTSKRKYIVWGGSVGKKLWFVKITGVRNVKKITIFVKNSTTAFHEWGNICTIREKSGIKTF